MGNIWALVTTIRGAIDLINRIMDSWIDYQAGQIDSSTEARKAERLALAKAMMEAKDDEQRKRIARVIYRLDHGA